MVDLVWIWKADQILGAATCLLKWEFFINEHIIFPGIVSFVLSKTLDYFIFITILQMVDSGFFK